MHLEFSCTSKSCTAIILTVGRHIPDIIKQNKNVQEGTGGAKGTTGAGQGTANAGQSGTVGNKGTSSDKAGMFWCMLAVVYAGFLFYYRGKGKKGLMKCILILAISLILFWRLLNGSIYAGFFYLTAVVLLLCAIHRAWFGKEKKRLIVHN